MQTAHAYNCRNLDVKNLCSRKLFELLSIEEQAALSRRQLQSVERELIERRHYLRELQHLRGTR